MIDGIQQYERLYELAQLPADDPARRQLQAELQTMDAEMRQQWEAVLAETDQLHAALAGAVMPAALEQSLLSIPLNHHPLPWWKQLMRQRVGWMHLALVAVVATTLITIYNWPQRQPPPPPTLDNQTAQRIASFAVMNHQHPNLLLASDDATKLQHVLAMQSSGITPIIPHPRGTVTLLGGGSAQLGNTTALFTRWRAGPTIYTLYEFDPKSLGLPAEFAQTLTTPANSGAGPNQYRVQIWPGAQGEGDWALVLENDATSDCFGDSCR